MNRFLMLACCFALVGLSVAAGNEIPLFSPPASTSLSPEIPLFESAPELDLFEQAIPVSAQVVSLSLFESAPKPPVEAPVEVKPEPVAQKMEVKSAVKPVEIDTRPVIHAYCIDSCKPCRENEAAIGSGDSRRRVDWHHSDNGEAHPWHIHNYAQKYGYPVFYYPLKDGTWKRVSGKHSMDELVRLTNVEPSAVVGN